MTEDLFSEPKGQDVQDIKMRNLKAMQQKVAILEETGLANLLVRSMNTIIQLRPRNATVGLCRLLAEQCTNEELEEVGIFLDDPPMGSNSALRPESDPWGLEPLDSDSDAEGKMGERDDEEGSPEVPEEPETIAKQALLDLFDRMYGPGVFHLPDGPAGAAALTYRKEGDEGPPSAVQREQSLGPGPPPRQTSEGAAKARASSGDGGESRLDATPSLPKRMATSSLHLPSAMLDEEEEAEEEEEEEEEENRVRTTSVDPEADDDDGGA